MIFLPGKNIPEWFTHRPRGRSMSFWFRNKFPAISLCLVIELVNEKPITVKFSPRVLINGNKQYLGCQKDYEFSMIAADHILLLKFEDCVDMVFSDNEWNHVEVLYADHNTNNEVPIKEAAKYSGIHVFEQTSGPGDIQFTNPLTLDTTSVERTRQRATTTTGRPQKDQNMVLSSPILTSTQPPRPTTEVEKFLAPQPILSAKRPLEYVRGETSERLPEDEVYPTTVQKDPAAIEKCREGDDAEMEAVSSSEFESEESSSNTEGSDSDDLFDLVGRKLSVGGQETMSTGASSGDASLRSIREAINALELLMGKDLSEVYSNPATQSGLHQLLDVLSASSHPKVTEEVKEAIVEFKRKVFASFQEFQATVESVNKLKNFEKHLARIQQEAATGKGRRKDLKNSMKKASLAIKAENSRKKELEAEIAALRKQLASKERDLEQLVLSLKNQEATLSTYSTNRASLDEQARALLKEADDLFAANSGLKHEGEAAEVKQSKLKSTWSTDLNSQLIEIKNSILGLYDCE